MKTITVCKAHSTITSEPVQSAMLIISDEQPKHETLKEAGEFFDAQAVLIMEALDILPGGTRSHLLALLLEEKASYLRVRGI